MRSLRRRTRLQPAQPQGSAFTARVILVIHHINFLAEAFASEWKSSTLTLLSAQFKLLWAKELKHLLRDRILTGGEISTSTGEPITHPPSAFSKLGEHFLGPLLLDAKRIGWDRQYSADEKSTSNT